MLKPSPAMMETSCPSSPLSPWQGRNPCHPAADRVGRCYPANSRDTDCPDSSRPCFQLSFFYTHSNFHSLSAARAGLLVCPPVISCSSSLSPGLIVSWMNQFLCAPRCGSCWGWCLAAALSSAFHLGRSGFWLTGLTRAGSPLRVSQKDIFLLLSSSVL